MSQSTVVSRRGMVPFNVTFEATGFTDADLCTREFADEEARGFSQVAMTEGQFPAGILSVVRGWISEDDAQEPTDRKVFVCVMLRVYATSVDNASRTAPPAVLLARIVDAMASTETGECMVSLEGNWTVTEVAPLDVEAAGQAAEDAVKLRRQAADLLRRAATVDGLQPFLITHRHNFGATAYIGWFKASPNEQEAASILDAKFEPERDEELNVESNVTVEDLTGTSTPIKKPHASAA
ncbi:hypothetical protein G3O06_04775 [Burkholderia sp. Ac-20345]|uniref:hypothetical protein n=1 Tax=Burkholderia sp. Ac-20345 TaxID=2703891 RepID=UPI00197CAAE0|nr:hypothetical protein [Burkholderia sp. Ac-20345]MBN3776884.1 hypothetical protein [Burkholderia sp. Ac-20345]